ncbi:glycosyltransferase family 4 protein [Acetobacter senegalensis]|uniref:glycosyltransferase family 4 protein n=1 Tax=Acetobacter senegalensis TaxID=446692 RepID=UPI001EDA29B6|nr:glycosyltransferase family 4 protein [Acetobacter senegalensis]
MMSVQASASRPQDEDAMPLKVMTVLPPRERFAVGEAGAISLLVQRMAAPGEIVVGLPPDSAPFAGISFLPVQRVFRPFSRIHRYAGGVARLARQVQPDLLEVHNRPDVALALRKLCPTVPVVLVLHNDPCGMRRARTSGERDKLGQAVAIVAVSEWVRSRFVSQNVKACVRVLPNSLTMASLPAQPDQREKCLLFAGRVVADKGADAFVAACAQLLPRYPDWRADMIGADRFGPDSPETPFLAALRPKAIEAGVVLHGYQPHEVVLNAMAHDAIVVVPSRWPEPFGMSALEAMGCGAALVASRKGSLPDVVGDTGLYADPDDLPKLVQVIERLMMDEPLRQTLGQDARQRAWLFDTTIVREKRRLLHQDIVREWRWKGTFHA